MGDRRTTQDSPRESTREDGAATLMTDTSPNRSANHPTGVSATPPAPQASPMTRPDTSPARPGTHSWAATIATGDEARSCGKLVARPRSDIAAIVRIGPATTRPGRPARSILWPRLGWSTEFVTIRIEPRTPARVSDRSSQSIKSGRRGAKNPPNPSSTRCPTDRSPVRSRGRGRRSCFIRPTSSLGRCHGSRPMRRARRSGWAREPYRSKPMRR